MAKKTEKTAVSTEKPDTEGKLKALGLAMDGTGAAEWLGHGVAELFGPFGPVFRRG